MVIGILSIQGDFIEHKKALDSLGVDSIFVKYPEDLQNIDGLIIPGGESTTISRLAKKWGLFEEIKKFSKPVMGTCAGAILMAKEVLNEFNEKEDTPFGLIDMVVKRNAFGRQIESFETSLKFNGKTFTGVFIRAPKILKLGDRVETLITYNDSPVMVREGNRIALTFHPELSPDAILIHEYFINMIK